MGRQLITNFKHLSNVQVPCLVSLLSCDHSGCVRTDILYTLTPLLLKPIDILALGLPMAFSPSLLVSFLSALSLLQVAGCLWGGAWLRLYRLLGENVWVPSRPTRRTTCYVCSASTQQNSTHNVIVYYVVATCTSFCIPSVVWVLCFVAYSGKYWACSRHALCLVFLIEVTKRKPHKNRCGSIMVNAELYKILSFVFQSLPYLHFWSLNYRFVF